VINANFWEILPLRWVDTVVKPIQRYRSMKYLNLLPVVLMSCSAIAITGSAQARVIDEIGRGRPVFKNAGTIVPANAESACVRDVVKYETRYQNQVFKGTLWIKQSDGIGCNNESRPKRITGYFEERSADGQQWCSGDLSLVLKALPRGGGRFDSQGSLIKWNKIKPVSGFSCAGAGQTPALQLRYIPFFER
jgi:hypothetical protein